MICKFCGREVKTVSGKLWCSVGGNTCQAAINKKHMVASNSSMICKFCGRVVKPNAGKLWASVGGNICPESDTKLHELS
jgi:ribosomal protein L24E